MEAEPLHGMTPDCPAAFLSSLSTLEPPLAQGQMDLAKATLKEIRPLGHEVSLWASAAQHLTARVHKDRLPSDLSRFLKRWLPVESPEPAKGTFHLLLSQSARGWQLEGGSLPWMTDPTWSALLQLPALRTAWAADLRASHQEHLLRLLPASWLMDSAPLPPGSVIPGLEISAWAELTTLHGQGRVFKLQSSTWAQTLTDAKPTSQWQETLHRATTAPAVLIEQIPPTEWLLARYEQTAEKIHLTTAWLTENGSLWKCYAGELSG
jgi:hypothetical protein